MNTRLINLCVIAFLFCCQSERVFAQSHVPIWPISSAPAPNGDPINWNRVNCTLGEIHGSLNNPDLHGAIDIDHDTPNCPLRLVQPGIVVNSARLNPIGRCQRENWSLEVWHEYPPNSGQFDRMTKYLHLNATDVQAFPLSQNRWYPTGEPLVHIVNGCGGNGHHLHFEMWERINGRWMKLNPLGNNTTDWALRYHQHLEGHEDTYNPQINDIFVAPEPGQTAPGQQSNGVASGYFYDHNTGIGLSERVVDNVAYCRVHLADTTPVSNFSVAPFFQYPNDRLILFGNIGLTANVRDVGINSAPGNNTSSGEGLTIRRLYYGIENPIFHIDVPIKYDLDFAKIADDEEPFVHQIFNTDFNNPADTKQYGNNDFIELRSGDDTYLSPHKLIEFTNRQGQQVQEQSNGVWFTKARADTEHVFRYTPDNQHIARCNAPGEAKYPDDEYTLNFFAQDDWGRINRAVNAADVNAKVTVIVDNFRPFVQQVELRSGDRSTQSI